MSSKTEPTATEPIGVLLMAYGGPASLDEVEPYVMDVRGGRPLSPQVLEEIRDRYRRVGGSSPLFQITQSQAIAIEEALTRRGVSNQTFVGMRHWYPYIKDAVRAIADSGIDRVVAICMAPHYSNVSVGAYFRQYQAALRDLGAGIKTVYVNSWHDHPDLIQAFAERVTEALTLFSPAERRGMATVFTAHSLPLTRLTPDDPYDRQQRETAALVAKRARLENWSFAYQSQGYSQETWLGPRVEEKLRELSGSGVPAVLIIPTGFVCDHIEILYDVDIAFRELAASLGLHLERTRSLNDDPLFIKAATGVIRTALKSAGFFRIRRAGSGKIELS